VVKLKKEIRIGEKIRIKGKGTDFTQLVESMQMDHEAVLVAKKGKEVGLQVARPVKEGDLIYSLDRKKK
jgi:translation initiation factor IF-2